MTSLTDLREVVDVVIGVDTHVLTHSAAALDARTGAVLGEATVEATADGYTQLQAFADEHATLRAWAIEGTGGHGAGLARHLARRDELVVELDRPERTRRRNGAKSDPLDASAPPGRRSPGPDWARPAVAGTARPCRCCWQRAVPRSRPAPTPNGSCSASSSPRPNRSGPGSAA